MGTKEDRLNDYLSEKWYDLMASKGLTVQPISMRREWRIGQTCDGDWVCIDCLDEYNETERGDGPWGHINPNNPDTFMKILAKDSVDEYPQCCSCKQTFMYMKLEPK